jgi:hypothetical protein
MQNKTYEHHLLESEVIGHFFLGGTHEHFAHGAEHLFFWDSGSMKV